MTPYSNVSLKRNIPENIIELNNVIRNLLKGGEYPKLVSFTTFQGNDIEHGVTFRPKDLQKYKGAWSLIIRETIATPPLFKDSEIS